MKYKIDDGGLKKAFQNAANARGFKLGLAAAALEIRGKFAEYPVHKSRPQAPYWTPKLRRGFWAKFKKGEINVPYVRGQDAKSQKLGQSWTTEARNNGLTQIIGTAVAYAPRVQSAAKQTQYHKKTGWKTDRQIMRDESPKALRTIIYYTQKDI